MDSVTESLRELLAQPWLRAALTVVAALVLAWLINLVLRRVLPRLARRTQTDLDDRLLRILRRPVFLSVVLYGIHMAVVVLQPPDNVRSLSLGMVHTLVVLLWLVAGLRICSTLLDALSGLAGRVTWLDERTVPLFDNLAKLILIGGAVYCLLMAWGLDVKPWLASAGIFGIAVGFAAKDTLANLFGGMFIIVDAPYKIGDFITLDTGERGRVTKIGLRSTRLLTRDDIEITLPNAQIANSKIVNESGGPWLKFRVSINIGVAYGSDVDHVREVLTRAVGEVDLALAEPAPRIRFIEMGDSALIFRVMCWVDEPVLRGQCVDALNTAVYKHLGAENINIPFPQRDVHIRQPLPAATH